MYWTRISTATQEQARLAPGMTAEDSDDEMAEFIVDDDDDDEMTEHGRAA